MFKTNKQVLYFALSLLAYTVLINWRFAIFIVGSLLWHENCHLFFAKRYGLKSEGITVIPFVGMVAGISGRYTSQWERAKIVLAGPVGGGLLAFVPFIGFYLTGWSWLASTAFGMGILNIFNLAVPVSFLDGGQLLDTITYSISRKLGVYCNIAFTFIGVLVLFKFSPILAMFIGILGGKHSHSEYKNLKASEKFDYEAMNEDWIFPLKVLTTKQILMLVCAWVCATITLVLMLINIHPYCANFYKVGF